MSESFTPAIRSITDESIEKLRVVGGTLKWEPSTTLDMRPTQEFKDAVVSLIEHRAMILRGKVPTLPLSIAIDQKLARLGINR